MRCEFNDFLDKFARPHLLVGHVETGAMIVPAEIEIGRLIETLSPKADWATGLIRDEHGYSVHCVFAREADARQLAVAVKAKDIGRYPGLASKSEFRLDATTRNAIATALSEIRR